MRPEELEQILKGGESQTVEFKASLAEEADAIQTAVAFANAQGGRILLGVKDDERVVGETIGGNTLENLSNSVKRHTYPSLPTFLEAMDTTNGKRIIIVEAPQDVPPMVGAYLYSRGAIPEDQPVGAEQLQALRRVGRVNQKDDFMRLRSPGPSEPSVVMYLNGAARTAGAPFPRKQEFYYSNSGAGWAFNVRFSAEHPFYQFQVGPEGISLPPWDQEDPHFRANRRRGSVEVLNPLEESPVSAPANLIATYEDEHGFTWCSRLELVAAAREAGAQLVHEFAQGSFARRIIRFPAKVG